MIVCISHCTFLEAVHFRKFHLHSFVASGNRNLHKAFKVVLTDDVFSEPTAAGKGSGKQGVLCGANLMMKTFVASKESHDKRTEQMQLGRDTTTYYVGLYSLPESADGNTARVFINKKIRTNNARMEHIPNWFDDNLSPSNTL
jgi:NAD(P)H-flavin reductase